MVAATLAGEQPEAAPGINLARSRSAEVDDGCEVLFFPERRRGRSSMAQGTGNGAVELGGGQFDRITRHDAGIETIEPAGV